MAVAVKIIESFERPFASPKDRQQPALRGQRCLAKSLSKFLGENKEICAGLCYNGLVSM